MSFRPYTELKSAGIEDVRPNNTGNLISKGTPVIINASGELDTVDVSIEASSLSIAGVATVNIIDGSAGEFTSSGKLSDITTAANFGDVLYISKSSTLTNVKPSIGVSGFIAGDLVIIVGVLAKNINNPSLKDLVLNINIIGQL